MTFEIRRLCANPPRFERVTAGFVRKSAALAWLIDHAEGRKLQLLHEDDAAFPDCVDVLLFGDQYAEQYEIRPQA